LTANPPEVHNWHVPVSLVDFKKLKDANWDITATKVSPAWLVMIGAEVERLAHG
jgi:hypothetical protein